MNAKLSAEATAQEPSMRAEPMEGQVSTEAAAGASGAPATSAVDVPQGMLAAYSPGLPELHIRFDSSGDEDVAVSNAEDPGVGVRQLEEAHEGDAAQPNPGHACPQGEHDRGMQQPAFQASLAHDPEPGRVQQARAGLGSALSHLQRQTDALMPVLRMLGPLSMLAARLMPAGILQYSKVEALTVGLVFGIFTSRAVILHSILCKEMSDGKELQHRTWVLAMTLAIWQWVPGSKSSTGQASGRQESRQPLSEVQEPLPHAAAQRLVSVGSPMFKHVPKGKRTASTEAGTASRPSNGLQAHSRVEHQTRNQQAAAVLGAAVRVEGARESGTLGQPRMVEEQAVRQARRHRLSGAQAAVAGAAQQAALPPPAVAAEHGIIPQLQLPEQPQLHRTSPLRAPGTNVLQTRAVLLTMPVAKSTSFVLPPPEEEFTVLQRTLMPNYQAKPVSAPGVHSGDDVYTDDDEDEIDIMSVSPPAEQPAPRREPDQALQQTRGGQGPFTFELLESGLVEGKAGNLYHRNTFTTKEDRTERMLDLREVMKAVGWTQLFSTRVGTRDMCRALWILIRQQAAREEPPRFLLFKAPNGQKIYTSAHRVHYLLRLSQIRTLYWISDEDERGLLDAFCKDVWANSVYESSMECVRVYEAQGAGQSGQERAEPARARGVKTLYARQPRQGRASTTPAAHGTPKAPRLRHGEASATQATPETPTAPVQANATHTVSRSAGAFSQGKIGERLDAAIMQPQSSSAPASAPQVLEPAGTPASPAGADDAVSWQPRQLSAHHALDSAQRQGVKHLAQDKSCKQAAKTSQQPACIQAGAGDTPALQQEGSAAKSMPRQCAAAAGAQPLEQSNTQAPGHEGRMTAIRLACEPSQLTPVTGGDGVSYPRTIFNVQDCGLMLDLRELVRAAGFPVSSKESSRDVCRKLWQKALTTAGELGIPDDALASQPPSLRRMLRTHHLLGLEHVQTLYLLATEVQRRGLDSFCKDVWPGQYERSMQEIRSLLAGTSEQAKASTAVGTSAPPALLPAAERENEEQQHAEPRPTQPLPSSQQGGPDAQDCSAMQQTGPARDQRMQEEQQQQLVQAQLQLPGTAARVMAVIRGTEESAVCIRQLLNTFSDRLPSEVAFYRKAKLEGGQRWATAEERLFLIRAGALGPQAAAAIVLTLSAAVRVLRHCGLTEGELAAIAALHEAPALTAQQLEKLPAGGAASYDAGATLKTHEDNAAEHRSQAPLPGAMQADEAEQHAQPEPAQPSLSPQQVSPDAQKCSHKQQTAAGHDRCMQQQQQQLLQVRVQLPGRAAGAMAVIRGPEESALCLRQLFNTFSDRLPSWRALSRKAGWEGGQRWATAEERLFLIRVGALGQHAAAAIVLSLPAAVRVLRRCGFTEGELAAVAALHDAPALTAAQLRKLPAADAEADDADASKDMPEADAAKRMSPQQLAVPEPPPGRRTSPRQRRKHESLPPEHERIAAAAQDASAVAAHSSAPLGSPETTANLQAGPESLDNAAATVSMKRGSTDKPHKQPPAAGASSDASNPRAATKAGSAPAVTGKRRAEASPSVRVTRARVERADQQQAAGGAWLDAIAVQSSSAKPHAPKRPCQSAPCPQVDSQQQWVHEQLGNADPRQQVPEPEQPEQESAQPKLSEFDPERDLQFGHAFLIHTEEEDTSKGWNKPWSVGRVTRLRKDKTKADVLWLKPEQKGGMWSSKWVPFEVEVFSPKKSRVDRIQWRSKDLDTGCFVCGTKLREDGTFSPEDRVMMGKAAKYVEGLARN